MIQFFTPPTAKRKSGFQEGFLFNIHHLWLKLTSKFETKSYSYGEMIRFNRIMVVYSGYIQGTLIVPENERENDYFSYHVH